VSDESNTERQPFRMDFVQEVIDLEEHDNKEGGTVTALMKPNPERYETKKDNDGNIEGYYDTLDDLFIPIAEVKHMADQMEGTPITHSPSQIDDIQQYIRKRGPAMKELFNGRFEDHGFKDVSEEFLENLVEENSRDFVILFIDIAGSTHLNRQLGDQSYARIIRLFHREIALLVGQFNGHVLKFLGDGLVAYFPSRSYTGRHDNSIDCALCMKYMVMGGINPVLKTEDLPEIGFRIGIDSGNAEIIPVGASGFKQEVDLIGETMNLASKIEAQAENNGIYLGADAERGLHTQWRKHTEEVKNLEDWDYKKGDNNSYKLYRYVGMVSG